MKYALAAILVIFASGCATTGSEKATSPEATTTKASTGHKNRTVMPGKVANPRKADSGN